MSRARKPKPRKPGTLTRIMRLRLTAATLEGLQRLAAARDTDISTVARRFVARGVRRKITAPR